MLLKRLKFRGHPILGDLELNFCDASGQPFDTVVIAGENGTGKTALLLAIEHLVNRESSGWIVEVDGQIWTAGAAQNNSLPHSMSPPKVKTEFSVHSLADGPEYDFRIWLGGAPGYVDGDLFGSRPALMSEASVFFEVLPHSTPSGSRLDDTDRSLARRYIRNLDQQIPKLLVDLAAQDAMATRRWLIENPGERPPESIIRANVGRFTDAIDQMITPKRFVDVKPNTIYGETGYTPIFTDGRTDIPISDLSTGEKQIIFRGGLVLRDLGRLSDAVVLVDEPELGLHPDWQARIVNFYRTLLQPSEDGHTQLIIATHSPFIVHGAVGARVIILERDPATGTVRVAPDDTAYPTVGAPAAVRAFNIDAFLRSLEPQMTVLVEGWTDEAHLKRAWAALKGGAPMPFRIQAVHGARNVQSTLNDAKRSTLAAGATLCGLFDFDGDGFDRWNGSLGNGTAVHGTEADGLCKRDPTQAIHALLLPVPAFRQGFASLADGSRAILTTEFIYEDAILGSYVTRREVPGTGGAMQPYVTTAKKAEFARTVSSLPDTAFAAFAPLFARLSAIRAGSL